MWNFCGKWCLFIRYCAWLLVLIKLLVELVLLLWGNLSSKLMRFVHIILVFKLVDYFFQEVLNSIMFYRFLKGKSLLVKYLVDRFVYWSFVLEFWETNRITCIGSPCILSPSMLLPFSQYAFNLFSHNAPILSNGYNEEEMKLVKETRKIWVRLHFYSDKPNILSFICCAGNEIRWT